MDKHNSILLISVALALAASPAFAEDAIVSEATKPHSHTHSPGEIDEEQEPFMVDVTYTFDVWRAARGGVRKGTRYIDNLDIVAEADMERLVGWTGAEVHLYGLYNNGKSISDLVGDTQAISNIETGVKAVRLYEAWINQKIGDKASIKVGLYDLNSEFDALDSAGLFMGSPHGIGTDFAQTGENGPSIFPVTSLAVRGELELADGWKLRAAVLDGVPGDPTRPKRTAIKLGNGDGALLAGEVEAPLADGKLLLGHWRYTARFDDLNAVPRRGNDGWYLRGESKLAHESGNDGQGLTAFFRLGIADGQINAFNRFASGGINYTGLVKGRDEDQLGLAVATAITGKEYRLITGAEKAETLVELTYRAPITSWLTIQPNVQYVINSGADPSVRNALAFGLRTELTIRLPR
jgi:porin